MSAPSAGNRSSGRNSTHRQSVMPGVASPVTTSLLSHAEKETPLIDGLKLTVKLHIKGEKQWLRMSLEDDLNLDGVTIDYPILCTTLDRRYHLQEATVIGMRRLVHECFEEGLISDSPGELMTVWKSPLVQPAHTPTPSEDDSAQSLTDLGSR